MWPVPAIVFGVAFGNLLEGVPFQYDDTMRVAYTGSFFALLNPFGLISGVLSLAMLVMHGGAYLQLRTEGKIQARALRSEQFKLRQMLIAGAFGEKLRDSASQPAAVIASSQTAGERTKS